MKLLAFVCALLAASAIALAGSPSASAKGCVRIDVAPVATAGQRVRVTVRTYASTVRAGRVVAGAPAHLPIPRFTLVAVGPEGRWVEVRARRRGRSAVRIAHISFPARGVWRVYAANWTSAPRSCAPPALVRVR